MRALRFDRYGASDVLHIAEIPEPVAAAGEAIVQVHAVGLNPLDWKIRSGHMRYVPLFRSPPRGVGCDFAGDIVAVGGGATGRYSRERVLGSLWPFGRQGALAERVVVRCEQLAPIPEPIGYEVAAALPIAGSTALQAIVDTARVTAGQRVLITGAAGGVGHYAIQMARHLGAEVTAVCSAGNAAFVRELGADRVIEYEFSDFTRGADRYDVVLDAASASSYRAASRVLEDTGIYLSTAGSAGALVDTVAAAVRTRLVFRQRAVAIAVRNRPSMWQRLLELVTSGSLAPHIERTIAMDEVAEAQRRMETGHGRGKIVVRM